MNLGCKVCVAALSSARLLEQERAPRSCLAAKLQCDPQLEAFTLTPAARLCRISTAVLLHPWQWCKVAGTAVFKHYICRQLYSLKSFKETIKAGEEKLVF